MYSYIEQCFYLIFNHRFLFMNYITQTIMMMVTYFYKCLESIIWIILFKPLWVFYRNGPHWFGRYGGWGGLQDMDVCERLCTDYSVRLPGDMNIFSFKENNCQWLLLANFYEWINMLMIIVIVPVTIFLSCSCCCCRLCLLNPLLRIRNASDR
jgi:hypothetical protein